MWPYIIDVVILTIFFLVLAFIISAVTGMGFVAVTQGGSITYLLLQFVLTIAYFAVFNSSSMQATPGKRAVGLKIIGGAAGGAGGQISFWRALGRYFAFFISALILGIGFFMIGWTDRKRGLHDMMAGTLVVKR